MKKLISILVAFAMMAMLSVTAFAAPGDPEPAEDAVAVTKQLNVANDIAIADVTGEITITFDFQSATGSAATNNPQVTDKTKTITISAANVKATEAGDASTAYYFTTGALDAEFFELNTDATKPGVYTYTVTEAETTNVTAGKTGEKDTGSETAKSYTLTIMKKANGDIEATASSNNVKVPINPGQTGSDIEANGLAFKNNLFDVVETQGYENSKFKMKKTVTDTAGIYANEGFEFTYTVKLPDGAVPADDVALVVSLDGTTETTYTGAQINTDGTANTVSLQDGGYVYFTKIPYGSKVLASETETALTGDTANAGKMYYTTDRGMDAAVNLDASGASAEVENISNEDSTMEGILHNSIPYVVLALVAIGGMAAYVIVRRRNADEA